MHSTWSPLPPRCRAEGCNPAEDQGAATYVHSHTCWNTSYLFKTTSNCTMSHMENVYFGIPSQKYSKCLNGSVFPFYRSPPSSFPCLSYYIGSCDSCYPPSFKQAKFVQGGLRQKSRSLHSFSSHTVESVSFYVFAFATFPFTDQLCTL